MFEICIQPLKSLNYDPKRALMIQLEHGDDWPLDDYDMTRSFDALVMYHAKARAIPAKDLESAFEKLIDQPQILNLAI